MKMLRVSILLIITLLFASACSAPSIGSVADMSGYEGFGDKENHVFIVSDVKDFLYKMDQGETFVAYFGFVDCPWCNDAVSLLNEEAVGAGFNVYYINTRPNKTVKANCEIPDYDLLVERVGEYFRENEEGVPYLYVPYVFFIKDGDVQLTHEGTIEGYDPSIMEMSEEMEEELCNIYKQGFDSIK